MGMTGSVANVCEDNTSAMETNTVESNSACVNIVIGDFTNIKVSFLHETIVAIRQLAQAFKRHKLFVDKIKWVDELDIPGLQSQFENQFATYILITMRYNYDLTITPEMVLMTSNDLAKNVIGYACELLPDNASIRNMLDSYPLKLAAEVCNVPLFYSQLLGEAVKCFIKLRKSCNKFLPSELHNVIEGFVPLVDADNALLTKVELEALYSYLESRKRIYVHIWLNSLFQLSKELHLLTKTHLEVCDIIQLCESSWLFLLLLTAQHNEQDDSSCDDSLFFNYDVEYNPLPDDILLNTSIGD